jgi:hypothetical protein
MLRSRNRLVGAAALGAALISTVAAAAAVPAAASGREQTAAPPASVLLLAPAPASPLAAGSLAAFEWAPGQGFERLPAREEWEAFLSLDGGRSYPIRITPHLDIDLHRAVWEVPAVTSADVRILMRMGDERHEVAIELPERFSIGPAGVASGFTPPVASAHAGEPARPGEPGVRIWSEGSRSGGGRRLVAASSGAPYGLEEGQEPPPALTREGSTLPATTAPRPTLAGPPVATAAHHARAAEAPSPPPDPSLLPPVDLLLQAMRRNE